MRVFQVRQGSTGVILWTGAATGEMQALDAMAHEAGYRDHANLPEAIRLNGLSVESLSFGLSSPLAAGRMIKGGSTGRIAERGGSGVQRAVATETRTA